MRIPRPRRAVRPSAPARRHAPVLAALAAIDPDALSPREALEQLYTLKKLASSS